MYVIPAIVTIQYILGTVLASFEFLKIQKPRRYAMAVNRNSHMGLSRYFIFDGRVTRKIFSNTTVEPRVIFIGTPMNRKDCLKLSCLRDSKQSKIFSIQMARTKDC